MQSDRIHGGALICSVEASNIRDHHDSFQRTFPTEIRFFLTLKNWPQLLAEASRALLTCFRFGQQWMDLINHVLATRHETFIPKI